MTLSLNKNHATFLLILDHDFLVNFFIPEFSRFLLFILLKEEIYAWFIITLELFHFLAKVRQTTFYDCYIAVILGFLCLSFIPFLTFSSPIFLRFSSSFVRFLFHFAETYSYVII
jgi:hypothetical protein